MEKLPDQTGSQILCPISSSGAVSIGSMGSIEAIKSKERVPFFKRKNRKRFSIPVTQSFHFLGWKLLL